MASSTSTNNDLTFPDAGLLPKEETGAAAFLSQYPHFDGRGVVVAILDTGVDPGGAGLQVTSDGKPKIIDMIDCSGSGDVDTSTTVEALPPAESGSPDSSAKLNIKGLTGRTLHLNTAWPNPSGKWHIGVKRAVELYPNGLKSRVAKEMKKEWTLKHREVEAGLQREVTAFKASTGTGAMTRDEMEDMADREARASQLEEIAKGYDDAGPLYDVVVWFDGSAWQAAVDVREDGDLRSWEPMTDFHVKRDWRTFNEKLDNLNFAVNIYEEGNICSFVVDAGSHGTHVAGITAAYHPECPSRNGLAPGAQIVSLKIGDSRLGSMETGVAFVRALREAVRLKVDMLNVSYGEATAVTGSGRVVELIEEIVHKHGIIYVGSASNNGPALSTVGAPGGTGTATIAAGAYLTPSMMEAGYSLRRPFAAVNFTWSSVGPAYDGAQGPTIMAPGGAITSVPTWTLQRGMLMNGTSMAAPNACGSLALVLSALKAQGLPYSPHLLRRAVTATAKTLPSLHPLVQGHGMVQVGPALDYVMTSAATPYVRIPLKVSVAGIKGNSCRGVYLREAGESRVSRDFKVSVEALFHEKAASHEKVNFEARVALSLSEGAAEGGGGTKGQGPMDPAGWVTIPSYFMLMNNGRGFNITVDGSRLPHGLHFCKVLGHDVAHPELGPFFEVPITVVKPLELAKPPPTPLDLGVYALSSGQVERNFLVPPPGATWMDVTLSDRRAVHAVAPTSASDQIAPAEGKDPGLATNSHTTGNGGQVIIVALQTVQLLPQTPFRDAEFEKYVALAPGQKETFSILVEAGVTVEIALAQYAISEGSTTVGITVEFRGLSPRGNSQDIVLHGGHGCVHVPVEAQVHDEEIAPICKLDRWQTKLTPDSSSIKALDPDRDVLPDGKQIYQLLLEYKFTTETGGDEVIPRAMLLNGVLYESPLESQFFMAFDANKKYLGCGDAWPGKVKCPKGENVLRYSVRHDDLSLLQGLKGLVVVIERALKEGKEVSVPDFATREEAMTRKKRGGNGASRMLRRGCATSFFLAEPAFDKMPKGVKAGDLLTGSLVLEKAKGKEQPQSRRPRGFRVSYVVPPPPPEAPKGPSKPTAQDKRTEETKLEEKVRDVKVQHLGGLTDSTAFESLFKKLLDDYPAHIPLHQARLRFLDEENSRNERLPDVVSAANSVIDLVDRQALASHFGVKVDENDPEAMKVRGDMEEKKAALVDALARKARALIDRRGGGEKKEGGGVGQHVKVRPDAEKQRSDEAGEKERDEEDRNGGLQGVLGHEARKSGVHGADVAAVVAELMKWDSLDQDKYARLLLDRDAGYGRWGLVLKVLNKLLGDAGNSSGIDKKELYERRLKVFEHLGWTHLIENERKWRVIDCPTSYSLF